MDDNYDIVKIFLYFPKLIEMEKRNFNLKENNNINEHLFDENKQETIVIDDNKFIKINRENKENQNVDSNYNYILKGISYLNYIINIHNNLCLAIIEFINNQRIIYNRMNLLLNNYMQILNESYINKL